MDMKTAPLSLLNDPSLLKTDALINGQWVKGSARFDVHDPATGLKLADVANLGPAEAEAAVAAAYVALERTPEQLEAFKAAMARISSPISPMNWGRASIIGTRGPPITGSTGRA